METYHYLYFLITTMESLCLETLSFGCEIELLVKPKQTLAVTLLQVDFSAPHNSRDIRQYRSQIHARIAHVLTTNNVPTIIQDDADPTLEKWRAVYEATIQEQWSDGFGECVSIGIDHINFMPFL